jgi:hypothetical protein
MDAARSMWNGALIRISETMEATYVTASAMKGTLRPNAW